MGHSFDMLTFDFLLKPPQPFTGLFLHKNNTGKIYVTQGKHREFHFGYNVATLYYFSMVK